MMAIVLGSTELDLVRVKHRHWSILLSPHLIAIILFSSISVHSPLLSSLSPHPYCSYFLPSSCLFYFLHFSSLLSQILSQLLWSHLISSHLIIPHLISPSLLLPSLSPLSTCSSQVGMSAQIPELEIHSYVLLFPGSFGTFVTW